VEPVVAAFTATFMGVGVLPGVEGTYVRWNGLSCRRVSWETTSIWSHFSLCFPLLRLDRKFAGWCGNTGGTVPHDTAGRQGTEDRSRGGPHTSYALSAHADASAAGSSPKFASKGRSKHRSQSRISITGSCCIPAGTSFVWQF